MPFLTVLTPTYNRAHLLPSLYESLCEQSCKDFIWLVIDDGSEDETSSLFSKWQQEADFEIQYLHKENGGKHRAINYAHPYLKGDLVVIVDSDDQLIPGAVSRIYMKWLQYREIDPALLIFQRAHLNDSQNAFDKSFPGNDHISTLASFINRGMSGDHCEVDPVELLKKYLFPDFSGEKFIGEAWLWHHIGQEGPAVFINEVIYLCEYLEGGLSKSGRAMRLRNPLGGQEHARVFLHSQYNFRLRFKNAMLYICYGAIAGQPLRKLVATGEHLPLMLLALIPGLALKCYWEKKYL